MDALLATAAFAGRLAVGPSRDGGAHLIGIDCCDLDLLKGKPWCSSELRSGLLTGGVSRGLPILILSSSMAHETPGSTSARTTTSPREYRRPRVSPLELR
jgi:hypothetical protein